MDDDDDVAIEMMDTIDGFVVRIDEGTQIISLCIELENISDHWATCKHRVLGESI